MKTKKQIWASLFSIVFFQTINYAQAPDWNWAISTGSNLNDYGRCVTTDAAGNVYVTGSFKGTVDFDPGPNNFPLTSSGDLDVFIIKYNNAGIFSWAKSFSGQYTDEGFSIDVDSMGNIYTTGHFQDVVDFDPGIGTFNLTANSGYDVFVAKLNSSGNLIWAKQIGGTSNDEGLSLVVNSKGSVFVTGYFGSTCDFNPDTSVVYNLTSAGSSDGYICMLDSSGTFGWAGRMGGTGVDYGESVSLHAQNSISITGHFSNTADLNPKPLDSLIVTSAGSKDIFLVRLGETGDFFWARSMGGTSLDQGYSLTADAAGNIFTTGIFNGTAEFNPSGTSNTLTSIGGADVFITKHDIAGKLIWVKQIGGFGNEEANTITIDASGIPAIYLSGSFFGTVDFDPSSTTTYNLNSTSDDIYVVALDTSGIFSWVQQAGGGNADYGQSLATSVYGRIYLTGWFHSDTMSFGIHPLINTVTSGFSDYYLAEMNNFISSDSDSEKLFSIAIFPNPANERFSVLFPRKEKHIRLLIQDITGKTVFESSHENVNSFLVNTENIANGFYSVMLFNGERVMSGKLIITH
jgi:hypothetical protein